MPVTLRQLEIFSSVVKNGSFSDAAKELNLSQPAVSMSVSQLENILGERVFDRVDRTLLLNDRGRAILPLAVELCSRASEIETGPNTHLTQQVGSLKIGASSTIGNYLLPVILGGFIKQHTKVNIRLNSSNTEQALEDLSSFKIDIAFIEGISVAPELQAFPWRQDNLVIVAHPNHSLAKHPPSNVHDLLDKPDWILRESGSGTRTIFENSLRDHLHELKVYLELGHTEAIKTAVASGLGVSCLSITAVKAMIDHGDLAAVAVPFLDLKRNLYIVVHKDKYRSRLMNAFLRFCEDWSANTA
ncbi:MULTISPECIES: LysR substrate-binding domain-containing protein [unclassified Oceanobacter]|uniref:LysR substrate-binding domain-containing protein n=1 Tax=unclassified Oceanobacter TaxID=2620260 RepID=UPI0026E28FCE|nr:MULTISPECIES: LysR substrate-binding domain-containing protein [unclassified Oceanobacter]MDO6682072.1 LysR substrate-binding domain-containing protein [Oceanobacter sp. 5_MG-2023]MDP2505533.1 LysR substrate-binding domain-containing protein [Oceanobacter sp. 3_MG-2023]MDP2547108.1 LysR substrate-binding domain-containing protein [Oceanobacter sp. 4_MG-2023]MDP2609733.1 LysR substrate-binding domain-containing protein [Oceanobacter sp. 1_MG-2023]MDP2613064.1 LysR substrate-binding domain-co